MDVMKKRYRYNGSLSVTVWCFCWFLCVMYGCKTHTNEIEPLSSQYIELEGVACKSIDLVVLNHLGTITQGENVGVSLVHGLTLEQFDDGNGIDRPAYAELYFNLCCSDSNGIASGTYVMTGGDSIGCVLSGYFEYAPHGTNEKHSAYYYKLSTCEVNVIMSGTHYVIDLTGTTEHNINVKANYSGTFNVVR